MRLEIYQRKFLICPVESMEARVDSLKVSAVSFTNYGVYLADINLLLQCVVAVMSIVYLSYKITKIKREK